MKSPARLNARHALALLLFVAGCFSSDTVAPNWLLSGTAHVTISGVFVTGESGTISRSDGMARMSVRNPNPAYTPPLPGATELLVSWKPTGDSHPEPAELTVILPYELGPAPRTLSFTQDDAPVLSVNGLEGIGASGTYFGTSGTITITSATDSTIAGTLDLGFARGVAGANLRLRGSFNAVRCDGVAIKCNLSVTG